MSCTALAEYEITKNEPLACLRPWFENSYRLVTLWSMLRFYAERFIKISNTLDTLRAYVEGGGKDAISDEVYAHIRTSVADLCQECPTMGLTFSLLSAERLKADLERRQPLKELRTNLTNVCSRLKDELSTKYLMQIEDSRVAYYDAPTSAFGEVVNKFGSCIVDIEESSRCLALGRSTASVFHLMRIMEVGSRALGKSLNDPNLDPKRNPSWEPILQKCDRELEKPLKERCAEWRSDDLFFSAATANLRAVKNAWRNPTMHVDILYDFDRAKDVFGAVAGFMRHLATRLSE